MQSLRSLWRREPARLSAVAAAVVVFVCAKAGLVISEQSIGEAVALVLPILLGGQVVRQKVIPVHSLAVPAEHVPGDHVSRP